MRDRIRGIMFQLVQKKGGQHRTVAVAAMLGVVLSEFFSLSQKNGWKKFDENVMKLGSSKVCTLHFVCTTLQVIVKFDKN